MTFSRNSWAPRMMERFDFPAMNRGDFQEQVQESLVRPGKEKGMLVATEFGGGFENALEHFAASQDWQILCLAVHQLKETDFGMPYGDRRILAGPLKEFVEEELEGQEKRRGKLLILSQVDLASEKVQPLIQRLLGERALGLEEGAPRLPENVRIVATTHDLREAMRLISPEVAKSLEMLVQPGPPRQGPVNRGMFRR